MTYAVVNSNKTVAKIMSGSFPGCDEFETDIVEPVRECVVRLVVEVVEGFENIF